MKMEKLNKKQQKDVHKEVKRQLKEKEKHLEKKLEKKLHAKLIKKSKKTIVGSTTYMISQFRQHTSTAMIAAFSFLIALVWKDFIVAIVNDTTENSLFEAYPYLASLYTAIIVTLIAVFGIALVTRWVKKPEKRK